jgi:serine/arginine repetitive matrix protein 2
LGVDQEALNELLARSSSKSSRSTAWTMLTRNNSAVNSSRSRRPDTGESSLGNWSPAPSEGRPSIETLAYSRPTTAHTRASMDGFSPRSTVAGEGASADGFAAKSGPALEGLGSREPRLPIARQGTATATATDEPTAKLPPSSSLRPPEMRRGRESANAPRSAVLRRTLIFPSDAKAAGIDLGGLARKGSARKSRRASAGSTLSSRSVHDRVPTPPPARSGGGAAQRRFSKDTSPPVPTLPSSFPRAADALTVPLSAPAGVLEHSSSTYDSLCAVPSDRTLFFCFYWADMELNRYEMYAGDGGAGDGQEARGGKPDAEPSDNQGSRPALEVIELANGETIWYAMWRNACSDVDVPLTRTPAGHRSIVNGLRDDEGDEGFYGDRLSFASEYSMHDSSEGVELFFKEHARTGSKDSAASYLSRRSKKPINRPETKVRFFASHGTRI